MGKPEVYVAEVVMSSLTGDVAELVCSVRGKPTPEVQWRKAGTEVEQDRRRRISWKGERNSLTILELGEDDLAEYTCHASNSQGEAEQSIQLTASVSSNESLSLCLSLVLFLYVLVRRSIAVLSSIVVKSPTTKTGPKIFASPLPFSRSLV